MFSGGEMGGEVVIREIVYHAFVQPVLFIDLENSGVLLITRGKNLRRFAGKKYPGVGAAAINEAANDEHFANECSKR
jgi:hypothetical protein